MSGSLLLPIDFGGLLLQTPYWLKAQSNHSSRMRTFAKFSTLRREIESAASPPLATASFRAGKRFMRCDVEALIQVN